jgi:hypothetical protein
VSDTFDIGASSQLPSSSTSNADIPAAPLSPHPTKAKQLMGIDFTSKPLLAEKRKPMHNEDGNIAALENEYSDVTSPDEMTFAEALKSTEPSIECDRIRETARDIYNGTELLVSVADAASWLMSTNEFNSKVRSAYMDLFDFTGLDVLTAVRFVAVLRGG